MLKTIYGSLLRRCALNRVPNNHLSETASQINASERLKSFRTSESNPIEHTNNHLGQFYKIADADLKHIFASGGLPKSFEIQIRTFNEACLMIREPAIDIISNLKAIDYAKPAVRFVLYGQKGCGKSLTLAHVLHYAYKDGFLIVHVPWVGNWMRRSKEFSNSESKEGCVDINLDAAAWLLHFKTQNAHLLSLPDYKTTEDHVWSKRETTPKGSPLNTLIEQGINRVKYASECIIILSEEIKKLSTMGICKTLVAIDGYNAFFYPNTRVYTEKKEVVHPHKVTVTEGFLNLTKFDWRNAAIVVTVDELAIAEKDQISYLPRYLLTKTGFEHMDPFVPIPVNNYSNKEFTSCMDYYRERKWVQSVPGQDEELACISASNPYTLMGVCAPL